MDDHELKLGDERSVTDYDAKSVTDDAMGRGNGAEPIDFFVEIETVFSG